MHRHAGARLGLHLPVPGERLAGFAAGYTGALVIRGLAIYLLASAIVLRARRPGRVLLAVFVLGSLALFFLGGMETTTSRLSRAPDGTVTATFSSSLTIGKALLRWPSAPPPWPCPSCWAGGSGSGLAGRWRAAAPAVRRAVVPVRVDAARLRTPRTRARAATVAAWEFVAQAPRMAWPILAAGLYAVWLALREVGNGPTFLVDSLPFLPFWFAAFFLPVLVWNREQVASDWDRARPADVFTQRLLQGAAGLAWLQVAVHLVLAGCIGGALAAGTLASLGQVPAWAWPGLPLCATALYCLGSIPAVLAERPVRWSIIGFLVLPRCSWRR